MGLEAMIYHYLDHMDYIETQPVFAQDSQLQVEKTNFSDTDILNFLGITGNCDHLLSFIDEHPNSTLLQNLLNYYTSIGSNNFFTEKNIRMMEQQIISLYFPLFLFILLSKTAEGLRRIEQDAQSKAESAQQQRLASVSYFFRCFHYYNRLTSCMRQSTASQRGGNQT